MSADEPTPDDPEGGGDPEQENGRPEEPGDGDGPVDGETLDSIELVRRAQGGDDGALNDLYDRYYARVWGLVRKRLGDGLRRSLESGDIVQDAMLHTFLTFSRLDVRSKHQLVQLFAAIVENRIRVAARHQRAQKRDRDREVPLGAPRPRDTSSTQETRGFEPVDGEDTPLAQLLQSERGERIRRVLETLPERDQRCIQLRLLERLPWKDVSEDLGLETPDAARMVYKRALIELKRRLDQGPED